MASVLTSVDSQRVSEKERVDSLSDEGSQGGIGMLNGDGGGRQGALASTLLHPQALSNGPPPPLHHYSTQPIGHSHLSSAGEQKHQQQQQQQQQPHWSPPAQHQQTYTVYGGDYGTAGGGAGATTMANSAADYQQQQYYHPMHGGPFHAGLIGTTTADPTGWFGTYAAPAPPQHHPYAHLVAPPPPQPHPHPHPHHPHPHPQDVGPFGSTGSPYGGTYGRSVFDYVSNSWAPSMVTHDQQQQQHQPHPPHQQQQQTQGDKTGGVRYQSGYGLGEAVPLLGTAPTPQAYQLEQQMANLGLQQQQQAHQLLLQQSQAGGLLAKSVGPGGPPTGALSWADRVKQAPKAADVLVRPAKKMPIGGMAGGAQRQQQQQHQPAPQQTNRTILPPAVNLPPLSTNNNNSWPTPPTPGKVSVAGVPQGQQLNGGGWPLPRASSPPQPPQQQQQQQPQAPQPLRVENGGGGGGGGGGAVAVDNGQSLISRLRRETNPKGAESPLESRGARFFVIKSYSEDDVHRSIKYGIWCSTEHGNKRLDQAFRSANGRPVYLLYSVNGSGHFCGVAQMNSAVDYAQQSELWAQDKWKGLFQVKWLYVKDVPNGQLRHIRLENNENKPLTNSRDTQEVLGEKGRQALRVIHNFQHSTSLFDDFGHYEQRQEEAAKQQSVGSDLALTRSVATAQLFLYLYYPNPGKRTNLFTKMCT